MRGKFNAIICGAGVTGIATAYYLAKKHGVSNALIIDSRPPMTLTSDKSGSLVDYFE